MEKEKVIRVGSRKSELALIQTKHVIARLQKLFPHKRFEIHTMSTIGDRVLNISLPKIGEKSLFTRDLEDALRTGGVDFVVHSLKDLPTALPTGMAIGAVLEREDARDALVLRGNYNNYKLATLPTGSVIGTSSLRRTAQLRRQYPHLVVSDIRGNLNTRLAKLDAEHSKFAGIILAQAGLVRMGWLERVSQVLEPTDLLYAVGQGALAVECRANDEEILDMLQQLMCLSTTCRILAERSFLKTLGGGCSAPVAVYSCLENVDGSLGGEDLSQLGDDESGLLLKGAVWSLDGSSEIRDEKSCRLQIGGSAAMKNATKRNGSATVAAGDEEDNDSSGPPSKRVRPSTPTTNSPETPRRHSPEIINDDAAAEGLSVGLDVQELIARHLELAKKCPVVGGSGVTAAMNGGGGGGDADNVTHQIVADCNGNGNNIAECPYTHSGNGGDAAGDGNGDANAADPHCPLLLQIGQDVMGECPFVSTEVKINLAATASVGKCPLTKEKFVCEAAASVDETDRALTTTRTTARSNSNEAATTSKCPFGSMHKQHLDGFLSTDTTSTSNGNRTHAKCPFLQKTIEMFDYADEEKPLPKVAIPPILSADEENLFCGLFRHACHNRDLYSRSEQLGQQLAEELIKRGALEVMKCAQAEIHSKA